MNKLFGKTTRRIFLLSGSKAVGFMTFGATLVGTVIAACGGPPTNSGGNRSGVGLPGDFPGTGSGYGNSRSDAGSGYGNNRVDAGSGYGNNWP